MYSPPLHPFIPTAALAREALSVYGPTYQEVFAFGPSGSHLYGLAHEKSDRDLMVVVAGRGKGKSLISEALDLKVQTFEQFMLNLFESAPLDVDTLKSGKLQLTSPTWTSFVENYRFSETAYRRRLEDDIKLDLHNFLRQKGATEARRWKALKVALRSAHLMERVEHCGQTYTPIFTAAERELFYARLQRLTEAAAGASTVDALQGLLHELVASPATGLT
jgi:hypothetical protein